MFACFHILCFKHLLLFLHNPSDLLSPFPTNQGSQLLCCGPTGSCVSVLHPQQREGSRWILSGKGESLEASLRSDSFTFCLLCVAWPGMEHDWLPHDSAAMPSPPLWVMHFQTVNNPSSPLKWLLVRSQQENSKYRDVLALDLTLCVLCIVRWPQHPWSLTSRSWKHSPCSLMDNQSFPDTPSILGQSSWHAEPLC